MTRLLFLVPSLGCGGAERQLVALANELGRRGHPVTIAVFRGGGVREADVDRSRVGLVDLHKKSPWDAIPFLLRLRRLVLSTNPAIIHGYLTAGNLAATATAIMCPRLRLFWGIRDSNIDLSRYGLFTRLTRTIAPVFARLAEKIIVNSQAGVEHATRCGYPPDRLLYIPNGIDTAAFYFDSAERRELRRAWGYSPSDLLIGLVGRIDPMKDHETFLKAAAQVARKIPAARFVCVGEGDAKLHEQLRRLSSVLGLDGAVRWLPSQTGMRAVYNAFDILCSSSSFGEGFPNVLGEAMACETPCVVTDVGDARTIVGDAGIVVPRRDPDSLAEALVRQGEALGRNVLARTRIVEHFSVEQLASRVELALAISTQDKTVSEGVPAGQEEVTSCRTH